MPKEKQESINVLVFCTQPREGAKRCGRGIRAVAFLTAAKRVFCLFLRLNTKKKISIEQMHDIVMCNN